MAAGGLISVASRGSAAETLERLTATLRAKGQTVFARIDHAQGAAETGLTLRPTTVVIFGNPKIGTPLMQANQAAGLDLPLRMLVSEDAQGRAHLTYADPHLLAARYGLGAATAPTLDAMAAALAALAREAAG